MNKEMTFIIFCIENYKTYKSYNGKQRYDLFKKYGLLDYLYNYFDILHTMDYRYVNKDIDEYIDFVTIHRQIKGN